MILENILFCLPLMLGLMARPPSPFTSGRTDIWLHTALEKRDKAMRELRVYKKALELACNGDEEYIIKCLKDAADELAKNKEEKE